MSSASNPYRPPSDLDPSSDSDTLSNASGEASLTEASLTEAWTVGFAGTLGLQDEDAWIGFRNSQGFAGIVRNVSVGIAAIVGLVIYWLQVTGRDFHLWPIVYFVIGLFLLEPYQSLCQWWQRTSNAAASREALKQSTFCQGGFSEQGGYWQNEDFAAKFSWANVRSASIGPSAVMVMFWGTEWYCYLPSRFFASPEQFHQLCFFLHRQFVADPAAVPSLSHLDEQEFGSATVPSDADIAAALNWRSTDDPFGRSPDRIEVSDRLEIDWVMAEHWSRRDHLKTIAQQLLHRLVHFVPLHVMAIGWLLADRLFYGDWSFVFQGERAWLFWFAYSFAIARDGYDTVVAYRGQLGQMELALQLVYTKHSVVSIQGDHLTWTRLSERMKLVSDATVVGWEIPDSQNPGFTWKREWMTESEAEKMEEILRQAFSG